MQKKQSTTCHRQSLSKAIMGKGLSESILRATCQVLTSIPPQDWQTRETTAKEMLEILEQDLPEQEKIRQILLMER